MNRKRLWSCVRTAVRVPFILGVAFNELGSSLPQMAKDCRDGSWKSMFSSERNTVERLVREWAIGNFRLGRTS